MVTCHRPGTLAIQSNFSIALAMTSSNWGVCFLVPAKECGHRGEWPETPFYVVEERRSLENSRSNCLEEQLKFQLYCVFIADEQGCIQFSGKKRGSFWHWVRQFLAETKKQLDMKIFSEFLLLICWTWCSSSDTSLSRYIFQDLRFSDSSLIRRGCAFEQILMICSNKADSLKPYQPICSLLTLIYWNPYKPYWWWTLNTPASRVVPFLPVQCSLLSLTSSASAVFARTAASWLSL